jgi:hypothetical protein
MAWIEPKTNWTVSDRFNITDYNRIKGNLEHLKDKAESLYMSFDMQDMGAEKIYSDYIYASEINKFEENLEKINQNIFTQDFGDSQTFVSNGVFITYDELNRVESATLNMYNLLDRQKAGLIRLSFRFGNMKGVQV